ncbi:unnamed protein product, partial [Gadus morhua 'NCC']
MSRVHQQRDGQGEHTRHTQVCPQNPAVDEILSVPHAAVTESYPNLSVPLNPAVTENLSVPQTAVTENLSVPHAAVTESYPNLSVPHTAVTENLSVPHVVVTENYPNLSVPHAAVTENLSRARRPAETLDRPICQASQAMTLNISVQNLHASQRPRAGRSTALSPILANSQ